MNILSIHMSHDGCVTYVKDNNIIFHTQIDRYNKFKGNASPTYELVQELLKLEIDVILLTKLSQNSWYDNWLYVFKKYDFFKNKYIIKTESEHHLFHAYSALTWNKKIKNIVVADGCGAPHMYDFERESFYTFQNEILDHKITKDSFSGNHIGLNYDLFSEKKFGNMHDNGKTMALSLYEEDAKQVQNNYEQQMDLLLKELNVNEEILLTGGCAQNILYNEKLLKNYSKVFCDPFNGDFGISLGHANFYTKNKIKNDTVYLGIPQDLDLSIFKKYKIINTTYEEVAFILKENPVAIFQSRSEQGQRGLGNRSLLMSPFNKKAQEKLNEIKKREYFRPFALSITEEKTNEWFQTFSLNSPHMMYTFPLKIQNHNLKSGVSINNKSRIQTVNQKNNLHFYNLLKKCSNEILVNTSLNLPGEVLVETLFDLKKMFENSKLNYIYFPEIQTLIHKNID